MAITEDFGALNNIPKKTQEYTQVAGDVVPMLKDPFVYIEMLLKQGVQPLETIAPMREIYGYDNNEAFEVLNNFLQR
jgi:hypothetical protein